MRNPKYDPLGVIPSAGVMRQRVAEAEEKLRKLQIVLRTAEELEQQFPDRASPQGQEVGCA